ncbi:MAG: AMIN domain-containing protein [Ruminococcaceae bacterium]|nr:AMIN domain-containing protein [Oscillospiraceae bacterium]
MKRFLLLLIAFVIFITPSFTFAATNNNAKEISLYIDNVKIKCDVPPQLVKNRTLVPVRAIFDAFDAEIEWNDKLKQVTIDGSKKIVLTIGSNTAMVDNKRLFMDTSAQIFEGRTLVPVRFISEALGYDVDWDSKKRSVYIYSPEDEDKYEPPKSDEEKPSTNDKPVTNTKTPLITDVLLTSKTSYNNIVEIKYTGDEEPNLFYLAYSNCIVMDFYGTQFTKNDARVRIDSDFINEVRYAIHDEYARVVIECNGKQKYTGTLNKGVYRVIVGTDKESYDDDDNTANQDKPDNNTNTDDDTSGGELTQAEKDAITKNFLKTRDEDNLLVVIDAGHGGSDPGAVYVDKNGKNVYEKDPNLYIALELAKLLDKRGIKYEMIREDDTYVDLIERSEIANDLDADLYVSIHNNAIANSEISGCMVLYNGNVTFSKYGVLSKDIAKLVNNEVKDLVPIKDRGIVSRPGLSVLKRTVMPAILIECAFGTNPDDLELICDEDILDLFALSLANAIEETFDIMHDKIVEAKK